MRKILLVQPVCELFGERALQLRLFAGVLLKGETPENTIGAGESM